MQRSFLRATLEYMLVKAHGGILQDLEGLVRFFLRIFCPLQALGQMAILQPVKDCLCLLDFFSC